MEHSTSPYYCTLHRQLIRSSGRPVILTALRRSLPTPSAATIRRRSSSMFRTGAEKPEQERLLLDKWTLETSPPELRQTLAYVLHLRSYWKPEGRAKLIVPALWMESSAFTDGECGMTCAVDRYCPFRNVRFESVAETRLKVTPVEEVPRDLVSQLLTNIGMDNCLATFVPRAFEGSPHIRLRSDVPAMDHFSQSTPRRIDFALVPDYASSVTESTSPVNGTRCLLLGMKESHSATSDSRSGPLTLASIPELTRHGQFYLTLLASLTQKEAVNVVPEPFPEWLVLFGLIYNARHVRVIAYVPHRRKSDEVDCAAYIVDDLTLRSSITAAAACERVLDRLRFLSALTTLRRHVHHLSKSLFTTIGPRDGIRRTDNQSSALGYLACDRNHLDDSESLKQCASLGSSQHRGSKYSTCPSSVYTRALSNVPVLECEDRLCSSSSSLSSSCCSTCLSLSESISSSESIYTGDTDFMEPSTLSFSQEHDKSVTFPYKLEEAKRRKIIAWAQQVVPTEHPVEDDYRMIICHPHPKR